MVKPWILSTNDPVILAIFLPKKKSGLAFFSPKNENIFGKTLDFVYERHGGFGNFSAQKEWIGIFLAKKRNYFWQNLGFFLPTTRWFWQIFFQKRVDWNFFFAKKRKMARSQNWQKHENCEFGQLVLIC